MTTGRGPLGGTARHGKARLGPAPTLAAAGPRLGSELTHSIGRAALRRGRARRRVCDPGLRPAPTRPLTKARTAAGALCALSGRAGSGRGRTSAAQCQRRRQGGTGRARRTCQYEQHERYFQCKSMKKQRWVPEENKQSRAGDKWSNSSRPTRRSPGAVTLPCSKSPDRFIPPTLCGLDGGPLTARAKPSRQVMGSRSRSQKKGGMERGRVTGGSGKNTEQTRKKIGKYF